MNRENFENQIIFRRRVVQKEGILPYPEGKLYKSSEELKKASDPKESLPLYDEHFGSLVGFMLKPEFGPHFRNGKVVRDIHFIKDMMTPDQLKQLNEQSKVELSMHYNDDTSPTKGTFHDQVYDGVQTNLDYQHGAWTSKGRADENYGVGLRVYDSKRNDSLITEEDHMDSTELDTCVQRKIPIIKKEYPDLDQKAVLGRAIGICRKHLGIKPTKKGDSTMSDPNTSVQGIVQGIEGAENVEGTEEKEYLVKEDLQKYEDELKAINDKLSFLKLPTVEEEEEIVEIDPQIKEELTNQQVAFDEKITKLTELVEGITTSIGKIVEEIKPKTTIPHEVNLVELAKKRREEREAKEIVS